MPDIYDVIVIGGGPAGCSGAIYTARAGLKTIILDKNPLSSALALAQKISNYPGQCQEIAGRDLLDLMHRQASSFGAVYKQSKVLSIDFKKNPKEVIASDDTYLGKTILVASGARGRKDRIKGEAEFIGKGISYCAICDAPLFQDSNVAIVGDEEEAIEDTLTLTRFSKKIYLITAFKQLKTDIETLTNIKNNPKIEIKTNFYLKEIKGNSLVTSIIIVNSHGQEEEIAVEGVFIHLPGNEPVIDFLQGSLTLGQGNGIAVSHYQETNVEGVFAAGDVTCQHMKQAVVAAAEGAIAAISIDKYLNKRAAFRLAR